MSIIPPNHQPENNLGGIVPLVQFIARVKDFIAAEDKRAAQDFDKQLGVYGGDAADGFHVGTITEASANDGTKNDGGGEGGLSAGKGRIISYG